MYSLYLLTGATGYLGGTVVKKLLDRGCRVRALVRPGSLLTNRLPKQVERVEGRVDDPTSLERLFQGDLSDACLIHCAAMISIASGHSERLWQVNVEGTRNVMRLCMVHKVRKVVHVSSVHAIPERDEGLEMHEVSSFSPSAVVGDYAKSKAAASALVLEAAKAGLDVSIVHPSGIIGPFDCSGGSVTETIVSFCNGKLPAGIKGGYDFVDVRDVADGILACCDKGRPGECYILSNRYASVKEILDTLSRDLKKKPVRLFLPLRLLKPAAPICEWFSRIRKKPLFLTPYSIYTLGSNALFSHEKSQPGAGLPPQRAERDAERHGAVADGDRPDQAPQTRRRIKNLPLKKLSS